MPLETIGIGSTGARVASCCDFRWWKLNWTQFCEFLTDEHPLFLWGTLLSNPLKKKICYYLHLLAVPQFLIQSPATEYNDAFQGKLGVPNAFCGPIWHLFVFQNSIESICVLSDRGNVFLHLNHFNWALTWNISTLHTPYFACGIDAFILLHCTHHLCIIPLCLNSHWGNKNQVFLKSNCALWFWYRNSLLSTGCYCDIKVNNFSEDEFLLGFFSFLKGRESLYFQEPYPGLKLYSWLQT